MSTASSVIDVEYPDSDGQPMGESDLHRGWMIQIINRLQRYYAGRQVYVTDNLILYYVKGNPKRGIVPDAFVTL
ncbi:MAG: Uma2 family endonuclease, partial [Planctomycetaceae bacterium]